MADETSQAYILEFEEPNDCLEKSRNVADLKVL
jgi:hypothetical protein